MSKERDKTRQKAAEARAAAESAEKRRERTVRIVGAVGVVVVVGVIIALAILIPKWSQNKPEPSPSAALPAGVAGPGTQYPYAVTVNPQTTGKPVLAIWEDFQCPACGQVEAANGKGIEKLAADGDIQLIWRPTTFIDTKVKNDSSVRATAAWGCAINAGKTVEYHNALYANQPATEGDGWTNDQLLQFGKDTGITGDAYTTFEGCVNAQTYAGWAVNSTEQFYADGVNQTPSATLDGVEVPNDVLADDTKLKFFLVQHENSISPSPTASASAS